MTARPSPADFFADAVQITQPQAAIPRFSAEPMGRVVTHDDPACSETGYRLDGRFQPHEDYGLVFWTDLTDYRGPHYRLDYTRNGQRHCMTADGVCPTEGWLNVQGRSFRIAGPSNQQIQKEVA